ncbi:hypothetical protein [Rhizobium sp. M10]|nr:hypothetical protein [Rhizobium sp. M10]
MKQFKAVRENTAGELHGCYKAHASSVLYAGRQPRHDVDKDRAMIVLGLGSCLIAMGVLAAIARLDSLAANRDIRMLRVF